MRPNVTVRCAAVAGAALTLAIVVPTAANASGHAVLAPGHIWFSGYYYPSNAVTAPAVLSTSSG